MTSPADRDKCRAMLRQWMRDANRDDGWGTAFWLALVVLAVALWCGVIR